MKKFVSILLLLSLLISCSDDEVKLSDSEWGFESHGKMTASKDGYDILVYDAKTPGSGLSEDGLEPNSSRFFNAGKIRFIGTNYHKISVICIFEYKGFYNTINELKHSSTPTGTYEYDHPILKLIPDSGNEEIYEYKNGEFIKKDNTFILFKIN